MANWSPTNMPEWFSGEMIGFFFSINATGTTGCPYKKQNESRLLPHVNISSKQIMDQNLEAETIK